tara:strand:- start:322 stop:1512 length:1191 start_codon:yes stop_codon:yes gene_type:complete
MVKNKNLQAVILAGGKGTRISTASINSPKPLIKVNEVPFIFYLIKQLDEANFKEVIILSGYMGNKFDVFIKKYKDKFLCNIRNIKSNPELNTGARLISSEKYLDNRFLLLYGDNYVPFDLSKYISKFFYSPLNYICAYLNNDGYSKSNIIANKNKTCTYYGRHKESNLVDVGYFLLNKSDIDFNKADSTIHLGNDLIRPLISNNKLMVEKIYQKYYTVGTIERFVRFRDFTVQENKNFILIDRDGVLNEKPEKGNYVSSYEEFNWKKGVLEALKILKENNYIVVIITNQACIAREILTIDQLNNIHIKMCHEVKANGGEIEYVYICPHHWDDNCFCRKPQPGLLKQAAYDLGFDLSKVIFIGDSQTDKEAASKMGCDFKQITKSENLLYYVKKLLT